MGAKADQLQAELQEERRKYWQQRHEVQHLHTVVDGLRADRYDLERALAVKSEAYDELEKKYYDAAKTILVLRASTESAEPAPKQRRFGVR